LSYRAGINLSAHTNDRAKYCTIAIGVYEISKPEVDERTKHTPEELESLKAQNYKKHDINQKTLLDMLKETDKLDIIGATSLWAFKSIETQQWLFLCVMNAVAKLNQKTRLKRGRGESALTRNTKKAPFSEIAPKFIYKLWLILVKLGKETEVAESDLLDVIFTSGSGKERPERAYIDTWIKKKQSTNGQLGQPRPGTSSSQN